MSGCFLTKLEVVTSRAGFRKPQTTHRGQNKRYNDSGSNAIGKLMLAEKKSHGSGSLSQEPTNECAIGCKLELFKSKMTLTASRQRQTILTAISLRVERHDGDFPDRRVRRELDLEVPIRTDNCFAPGNRNRRARCA